MNTNIIYNDDCLNVLKTLPDNSIDLLCTDPPAGISFMNKFWDNNKGGRDNWIKWLKEIMIEVKRILKPGSHGFVWSLPRTSHWTAMALEDAGFEIRDCIIHTFSSGFPKSHNVGLKIDKMNGMPNRGHRIAVANRNHPDGTFEPNGELIDEYKAKTNDGKKYQGFGTALKPACEYWWMIRKPLSEKNVAENVLKWGTGAININDCRIPYVDDYDEKHQMDICIGQENSENGRMFGGNNTKSKSSFKLNDIPKGYSNPSPEFWDKTNDNGEYIPNTKGRFPANIIVSDDVLNDGKITKSNKCESYTNGNSSAIFQFGEGIKKTNYNDKESFSRYFDLDQWAKKNNISTDTFPFIICPKASKREKNCGCENINGYQYVGGNYSQSPTCKTCNKTLNGTNDHSKCSGDVYYKEMKNIGKGNFHPTVKSLKLMSYLITLGSRPDEIVLDPFAGSGTTLLAAKNLNRKYIGMEKEKEYWDICNARLSTIPQKSNNDINKTSIKSSNVVLENDNDNPFFG